MKQAYKTYDKYPRSAVFDIKMLYNACLFLCTEPECHGWKASLIDYTNDRKRWKQTWELIDFK